MIRVRFHGRGGQGAKVASRILGTAAFTEGFYAQDFPLYGAERRGAPIAAFTRICRGPILERGIIAAPDIVIIMDETLLDDGVANPLGGMQGGGIVFINTPHTAEEASARYKIASSTLTLDLTRIGLEILGKAVLSSPAGGVAARLAGISEDSLRMGVEKETAEIVSDRGMVEKNIEAALHCYHAISPLGAEMRQVPAMKGSPVVSLPYEPAVISAPSLSTTATTPLRKTGNWRVFRPVWDYEKCTKCMTCVARCPDGCISINAEGFPFTDYENCKGCMVCAEECPVQAISTEREVG